LLPCNDCFPTFVGLCFKTVGFCEIFDSFLANRVTLCLRLELISYPHPILEDTLARTYGVILFQEQALQVLMKVAGFTGAEAEQARRAMTHKRSRELMEPILKRAREGMCKNKIDPESQDKIVNCIESFLGYAFPESHAYSFGLIAYASGYLKCHYLAAFTAGLLNAQPMGFYSPSVLIKDAQRHGLHVKPADVTRSEWDCSLEKNKEEIVLRLGFRYVRKMREETAKAIVAARRIAMFDGIPDLTRRVRGLRRMNYKTSPPVRFESSGSQKPTSSEGCIVAGGKVWTTTGPLFNDTPDYDPTSILLRMSDIERLITDHHISGFTIGPHPMAYRRADLKLMNLSTLQYVKNRRPGEQVETAGEVTVKQRPGTAKGIVFLTLHDETDFCDVVVKPAAYEQYRTLVNKSKFLRTASCKKLKTPRNQGPMSYRSMPPNCSPWTFPESRPAPVTSTKLVRTYGPKIQTGQANIFRKVHCPRAASHGCTVTGRHLQMAL
jgi:error-prone DNA polymerase